MVGAVMVPLPPPPSIEASKSPASSEVTVCVGPSMSVMVIFAPGLTLMGTWYAKSLMVILASAAGLAGADDDPLADGVDVPEGVALAALVVDEAAVAGVDAPCPVLVGWLPLLQAPRRMTLQVAASAPVTSRAVMGVRPFGNAKMIPS